MAEKLLVTDDVNTLQSLTVALVNPLSVEESITVTPATGITLISNSTVLQLQGPAPQTAFTDTLRTLTYNYPSMNSLIREQPVTTTRYTYTHTHTVIHITCVQSPKFY